MKKLLIIALLGVSATCQPTSTPAVEPPAREATATIVGDKLPVDGCQAHILLEPANGELPSGAENRWLPTEKTRPLMDKIIEAETAAQGAGTLWMGRKSVLIRYRETALKSTLQCGWNTKQALNTIELLDVNPR